MVLSGQTVWLIFFIFVSCADDIPCKDIYLDLPPPEVTTADQYISVHGVGHVSPGRPIVHCLSRHVGTH